MIPYIGDISKNDALVLKEFAENSQNIIEFGCGASTQVLSKYSKKQIISIDTSKEWINKTISNIKLLEITNIPIFTDYDGFMNSLLGTEDFDFVFDDGRDNLRRDFAIKIWGSIKIGGSLAFHDTRRWQDAKNVCWVLEQIYESVNKVIFNYAHSNITLIYKKKHEPYENWQIVEGKEQWEIGYGEPYVAKIKRLL